MIPSDAIAHMGFFYNTLNMGHRTDNPFDNVENYAAFHYKEDESSESLINIYKRIIIPMHPLYGPQKFSDLKSESSLSKRYGWYPNREMKTSLNFFSKSPSPKKFIDINDRRGTQQFSLNIIKFEEPASASPNKAAVKFQDNRKLS